MYKLNNNHDNNLIKRYLQKGYPIPRLNCKGW